MLNQMRRMVLRPRIIFNRYCVIRRQVSGIQAIYSQSNKIIYNNNNILHNAIMIPVCRVRMYGITVK